MRDCLFWYDAVGIARNEAKKMRTRASAASGFMCGLKKEKKRKKTRLARSHRYLGDKDFLPLAFCPMAMAATMSRQINTNKDVANGDVLINVPEANNRLIALTANSMIFIKM